MEQLKTKASKNYVAAVGRRREAAARVRIYSGGGKVEVFGAERKRGEMVVNGKPIAEYFKFVTFTPKYTKILEEAGINGKYVISARIIGGGLSGQLDALVHGIARALDKLNKEKYHKMLSDKGYLTRDPRTRERRKVGMGGKARRKKQSPKR